MRQSSRRQLAALLPATRLKPRSLLLLDTGGHASESPEFEANARNFRIEPMAPSQRLRRPEKETKLKRRCAESKVLRSIGKQLECFTLANVIDEVMQWMIRGKSSFRELAETMGHPSKTGILNRLVINAAQPS